MKNSKIKKSFIISIISFLLFIVLILLLLTVDIKDAGILSTKIGLGTINLFFRDLLPYNEAFYKISNYLGYLSLMVAVFFMFVGIIQLIKRKSIKNVDKEILLLGCLYTITILFYILFTKIYINYRPVLIDDELESSFPSSHTMLVMVIFGSSFMISSKYIKKQNVNTAIKIICILIILITIISRTLSGAHWILDIIGGITLSISLLSLFSGIKSLIK